MRRDKNESEIVKVGEAIAVDDGGKPTGRARSVQAEYHAGPLPHPSILEGYEKLVPGAAREILDLTKAQSAHRMHLEDIAVPGQLQLAKRGQMFGFILALIMVSGSLALLTFGRSIEGLSLVGFGVAGFGGAFVYDRKAAKDERVAKKSALQGTATEEP